MPLLILIVLLYFHSPFLENSGATSLQRITMILSVPFTVHLKMQHAPQSATAHSHILSLQCMGLITTQETEYQRDLAMSSWVGNAKGILMSHVHPLHLQGADKVRKLR